jgi:hypothetical protein
MIALGRVAVALDGDSGSQFINPALLSKLSAPRIGTMYSNLGDDLTYRFLGISNGIKIGGIGVSYVGSTMSGFPETTIEAGRVVNTGRYFDYTNSQLNLAFGNSPAEWFSWGTNLKFLSKGFSGDNGNASAIAGDLGILITPKENLAIGIVSQNLASTKYSWRSGSEEVLEQNIRIGVRLRPIETLLLVEEIAKPENGPATFHGGVEYLVSKDFAIRFGVDQIPTSSSLIITNLTGGVGLSVKGFRFDYAYYYDSVMPEANSTHYLSIGYQWENNMPKPVKTSNNDGIENLPLGNQDQYLQGFGIGEELSKLDEKKPAKIKKTKPKRAGIVFPGF